MSKHYPLLLFLLPAFVFLAFVPMSSGDVGILHPFPNQRSPNTIEEHLARRQAETRSAQTTSTSATSPSTTKTGVPQAPTLPPTATGAIPTPFPAAFDLSLSLNFTSTDCQDFFLNFTQSEPFRRCRPFSLLFGSSSQFSQAMSNATLLTAVMWGTCNTLPSATECAATMDGLAAKLEQVCGAELKNENILASQAHTGFRMFAPMRQAGCLVNNKTRSYCFAEASSDASPIDLYFWELPYGSSIPAGSVPTCSDCIRDVLAIYAGVVTARSKADNATSLPLDSTYPPAAQLAAKQCGSAYAQQVITSGTPAANKMLAVWFQLFISSFLSFHALSS